MNISESDYSCGETAGNEAQKGNVPLNETEDDYESVDIGDQQNKYMYLQMNVHSSDPVYEALRK